MNSPEQTKALSDADLEKLLKDLESPKPEVRCAAALKLGRSGNLESAVRLEAAVKDPNTVVEYFARTGLELVRTRFKGEFHVDLDSLHRQLGSPYLEQRIAAIVEVATIQNADSLPALVVCLEQETEPYPQALLVRTVLSYREAKHRTVGLTRLTSPDDFVRASAVEGFWGWNDPSVDRAVTVLGKDRCSMVRRAVSIFLIQRGLKDSKSIAEKLVHADDVILKIVGTFALTRVEDPWARQMLGEIIKNPKLPLGVKTLARLIVSIQASRHSGLVAREGAPKDDQTIRTDLTAHFAAIPDGASLRRCLQSSDPIVRIHGLQNAVRFPRAESLSLLTRLVEWETDSFVLATLVKALATVGGGEQGEAIQRFLDHDDPRVRANTLQALGTIEDSVDLVAICKRKLMVEDAARVRTQAASYLFKKDPEEAVRHFKRMVLGEDGAAREGALLILTTMQDERTLPVFREALLDPRREVYVQAHQLLESVSGDWEKAKKILADFLDGKVAGEVVEGEPVSALLATVNSPHAQERINAIRKLAAARDPRVEVVLELNLTSKDPSVRKEATRALRRRHQEITLPLLLAQLGQSYLDSTRDGHALVPHPLRLKLERAQCEHRQADRPAPPVAELGRILLSSFEGGEPFDASLRAICQEIRAAIAQVAGESPDGATAPLAGAAGSAATQRKAIFEKLLLEAESGPEIGSELPEALQEPRMFPLKGLGAAFVGIWIATILAAYQFSEKGGRPAPVSMELLSREQTVKSLDAMALELDPDQFRQRFWGTKMSFTGHLERLGDDLSMALVRRGSALFKVTPLGLAERLPKGLKRGAVHVVTGAITGVDGDGTISLEGTLQAQTGGETR